MCVHFINIFHLWGHMAISIVWLWHCLSQWKLAFGKTIGWILSVSICVQTMIKVFLRFQELWVFSMSHFGLSQRKVAFGSTLRKHAYSNVLKISAPKTENFQLKNSDIFHISAQNIDCGYSLETPRQCGSNDYPQSMCLSRNKKNNVYPL